MSTADVMVVYFDHRPHARRDGHIQPNGDIEWDNNIKWVKHEGAWPAPVASSSSLAKTTAWGVQRAMKKSHSCNFWYPRSSGSAKMFGDICERLVGAVPPTKITKQQLTQSREAVKP